MPSRRSMLIGGGAVAAAGGLAWRFGRKPAPRPRGALKARRDLNVLFILTDQERSWDQTPLGFVEKHLPARMRLAEQSADISHMYTPIQLCSMARGVVYSGLHSQNNGVWENVPIPTASDLSPSAPTLGSLFQDAGFRTGYAGKWHLSKLHPRNVPLPEEEVMRTILAYGFDETELRRERDGTNAGFNEDGLTVEASLRFIERGKGDDRPWFLAVNLLNPHDIMYYTSGEEMTQSRVTSFPDPSTRPPSDALYQTDLGYDVYGETYGCEDFKERPAAIDNYHRSYSASMGLMDYQDTDIAREFQNYYWNCMRDCDRHLMTLLNGLEESGEADRTVIVFTSDHGEFLGAHALRGKGVNAYREGSHVPLLISHPDGRSGRVQALASQVDLAPTLLGLAGVDDAEVTEQFPMLPGYDLSSLAYGARARTARDDDGILTYWTSLAFLAPEGPELFAAALEKSGLSQQLAQLDAVRKINWDRRGQMRGVFDGRFTFSRYFSPDDHHLPRDIEELLKRNDVELYDNQLDPDQTRNLAGDPAYGDHIEALNRKTNALIAREIGTDRGNYLPMFAK